MNLFKFVNRYIKNRKTVRKMADTLTFTEQINLRMSAVDQKVRVQNDGSHEQEEIHRFIGLRVAKSEVFTRF